ncbi:hypothetical protein ACTFIY_001803 [Dictyostelium cf. discoideum]
MKRNNNSIIPLLKIKKLLKRYGCKRIQNSALVFFSKVLQYLIEELLEISMNVSILNKTKKYRIKPKDISWSIQSDPEFNLLFRNIIIPSSGRISNKLNRIIQRSFKFKSFKLDDYEKSDYSSKTF